MGRGRRMGERDERTAVALGGLSHTRVTSGAPREGRGRGGGIISPWREETGGDMWGTRLALPRPRHSAGPSRRTSNRPSPPRCQSWPKHIPPTRHASFATSHSPSMGAGAAPRPVPSHPTRRARGWARSHREVVGARAEEAEPRPLVGDLPIRAPSASAASRACSCPPTKPRARAGLGPAPRRLDGVTGPVTPRSHGARVEPGPRGHPCP
jgi:hypothetical protein